MPVLYIDGPSTLSGEAKKTLIEDALRTLVEAYKMTDDRVYISEFLLANVGHTSYTDDTLHIQSEPARVVCKVIAPPGLQLDAKRKMIRTLTDAITKAYGITNGRNILIFLDEHPIENAASNGYLQTENPAFQSPATQQ
jgi:phenylpyruvate tautomerase PptA (4-oxalocrotonate tautomerase family)